MTQAPLFQLTDIELNKNGKQILSGVNLQVNQGECLILAGENGAGKTSLLRLFNRMNEPSSGEIRFKGQPLNQINIRELRHQVGTVMQGAVFFDGTVTDVLRRIKTVLGEDWTAEEILHMAGLPPETGEKRTSDLSGGETQLLGIGIVAVRKPDVILLDEPASSLSITAVERLEELLCRLKSEGRTLIQVTHQVDRMVTLADRGVFLKKGVITMVGDMKQVAAQFRES